MDPLIKQSLRITSGLVIAISVIVFAQGNFSWALGFLCAAAWSMVNFLLTIGLLKIAILEKSKAKLSLILLIKFPLLYLVGFLLLSSKKFPVSSLLLGVLPVILVTGALKIWPKRI